MRMSRSWTKGLSRLVCWPEATLTVRNESPKASRCCSTGASLIASGRVPKTVRIFRRGLSIFARDADKSSQLEVIVAGLVLISLALLQRDHRSRLLDVEIGRLVMPRVFARR